MKMHHLKAKISLPLLWLLSTSPPPYQTLQMKLLATALVRVTIRFIVWLVSGYANIFKQLLSLYHTLKRQ